MNFGECLKSILTVLDISMSRLSKQINVDSSLVCRWVNGKRVPQYGTNYIEHISDYLSKNINNTLQEQEIIRLYKTIVGPIDSKPNFSVLIYKILKEAQGYTLEQNKTLKQQKKTQIAENDDTQTHKNMTKQDSSVSLDRLNSVSLSQEDLILFGNESIMQALNSLIIKAIDSTDIEQKIIYFTYNFKIFDTSNDILKLKDNLVKAMECGWKIVFLIRISTNISGLIDFLYYVIPYLKTGNISVFYSNDYKLSTIEREVFAVPKLGAISTLSIAENSINNYGFYLRSQAAIQLFTSYITSVIATQTSNLITYYPYELRSVFIEDYKKTLSYYGDIYNYNHNFNIFLINEVLYEKLLQKTDLNKEQRQHAITYHRELRETIELHLRYNKYYEIYFIEAIEVLKQSMEFKFYTPYGERMLPITTQEFNEYIESIVNIMNAHDNYHVAIIYRNAQEALKGLEFSMKGRYSIYVDKLNHNDICFTIEEPMAVKGMEEFYLHKWNRIAPINKDKIDITNWLLGYIHPTIL